MTFVSDAEANVMFILRTFRSIKKSKNSSEYDFTTSTSKKEIAYLTHKKS